MIYASSKDRFKRELDGIQVELQATDPTEMDLDIFKSRANWGTVVSNFVASVTRLICFILKFAVTAPTKTASFDRSFSSVSFFWVLTVSCLKLKDICPVLFYNRVRNPNRLSTDDPIGALSLIYMRCLVIPGFKQMIYDKVDCLVYQQIRSLDQYSVDCIDLRNFISHIWLNIF